MSGEEGAITGLGLNVVASVETLWLWWPTRAVDLGTQVDRTL